MGILSSALKIGESAGGTALRTLNAQLFPKSATKVRKGEAVNDIINLNVKTPNRYAKPPFPSSKGAPWSSPSGDPRAAVTGAARREELIQKRKTKRKAEIKNAVSEVSAVKKQGSKLIEAVNSGNATPMEGYRGMGILNNRAQRVVSEIPTPNFKPKKPVKGSITKSMPKGRVMGPDTQMQSKVDDLFGVKW